MAKDGAIAFLFIQNLKKPWYLGICKEKGITKSYGII